MKKRSDDIRVFIQNINITPKPFFETSQCFQISRDSTELIKTSDS